MARKLHSFIAISLLVPFSQISFGQASPVANADLKPLLIPGNKWNSFNPHYNPFDPSSVKAKYHDIDQYEVLFQDTLLGDYSYYRVKHSFSQECLGPQCPAVIKRIDTLYLRQGVNRIYQAPDSVKNPEKIWFNFTGTLVGDTIMAPYPLVNGSIILKIDTVDLSGSPTRRFYTMLQANQPSTYVDGIGFTGAGIAPKAYYVYEGGQIELTCAEIEGVSFKGVQAEFTKVSSCYEPIVLGVTEDPILVPKFITHYVDDEAIEIISPQPATSYIYILFDLFGKNVYQTESIGNVKIQMFTFLPGIYILKALRQENVVYQRKVLR